MTNVSRYPTGDSSTIGTWATAPFWSKIDDDPTSSGGEADFITASALSSGVASQTFSYTAFTAPGTIYVGLWTAALTDASTGSTAGEVATGTAYARMGLAQGTAQWTASSGGTVKNTAAITFPTATADWGTITYVGLVDAATTGNLLYWAQLDASKIVQNGDTFQFAANALVVAED